MATDAGKVFPAVQSNWSDVEPDELWGLSIKDTAQSVVHESQMVATAAEQQRATAVRFQPDRAQEAAVHSSREESIVAWPETEISQSSGLGSRSKAEKRSMLPFKALRSRLHLVFTGVLRNRKCAQVSGCNVTVKICPQSIQTA